MDTAPDATINNPKNQCCGSGTSSPNPGFEFFHLGSRIYGQKIWISDPGLRQRTVAKLSETLSVMIIWIQSRFWAGSGCRSVIYWYGSAYPDPFQNVKDWENQFLQCK